MSDHGEQIDAHTIRFRRILPGPIEPIWEWMTDGEKRRQWLAGGETQLHVGGKAELFFNNSTLTAPDDEPPEKYKEYAGDVRFVGEVVEVDPPRLIRFTWPEADGKTSEVTIALEEKGEKIVLTLTHRNLTTRSDMLSVSSGWHAHFDIMIAKLAGETPPRFWAAIVRLESEYDGRLER